jgi:beta-ketodecanoyl-[acyl-carrier-protein] synthase
MKEIVLSGTGLFTPSESISNQELVDSFNSWVAEANRSRPPDAQLPESSAEFVVKASGIQRRYVMNRSGILDPQRMRPYFEPRPDSEPSLQAEMGEAACREALANAGVTGEEVDAVLVACSNLQRPYPAVAVELQQRLNAGGFAYDMNVACSSATFGIAQAVSLVQTGAARRALVVSPEICTAHLNFRDRDSHFIFGDACTAVVVEAAEGQRGQRPFQVLGCKLTTRFSNNIRNNRGFLTRCEDRPDDDPALLFYQEGRRVFKDVTTLVAAHLESHLAEHDLPPDRVKTYWLHQANAAMNALISKRLLGREASAEEAPVILDEYANTSSAGSVIAFHQHQDHLSSGDHGVICSFGAGYSIGSVILRKL